MHPAGARRDAYQSRADCGDQWCGAIARNWRAARPALADSVDGFGIAGFSDRLGNGQVDRSSAGGGADADDAWHLPRNDYRGLSRGGYADQSYIAAQFRFRAAADLLPAVDPGDAAGHLAGSEFAVCDSVLHRWTGDHSGLGGARVAAGAGDGGPLCAPCALTPPLSPSRISPTTSSGTPHKKKIPSN